MAADQGDESGLLSPVFYHDAKFHDPVGADTAAELEVSVIFTDIAGTRAALRMAEELALKLRARIHLFQPYEVPYALPLNKPPIRVEFLEAQARELARGTHLNVAVQILLCRDRKRALGVLLKPDSLVVIGGRKRWWPTPSQKLARALRGAGHDVTFARVG